MSNAPASIYKTQKTCPLCSEKAEFELPQDFHCPRCGRRKSLFLQAFDSHSSGVIHDKVVYLEDQVRVRKQLPHNLSICPNCGGPADNGHDRCVPPSPYWCTKCEGRSK